MYINAFIKYLYSGLFRSFNSEYFTHAACAIIGISHVGTPPWQWSDCLYVHLMD